MSESKNQLPRVSRWIMAVGALLWAIPAAAATASYVVTVDPEDKRLAFVEARITTNEDSLLMYPEGADHRPAGWSTYLRNLVATDGAGREVDLQSSGRDRWVRPPVDGDELIIRYEVLIHHDAGRWPFGWDEAAYVKGDSIFYTGKALFILALDLRDIIVEFRIPEKWGLVTPWSPADRPRSFRVADPIELTEVAIMTGLFTERMISAGDASVTLAAGPGLLPSLPLVEETVRRSLGTISEIFCGSPPERFVIAMNLEDAFSGGGAFRRSVSMLFQEPPALENRAEWSHIIVHELLHLWIGAAMEAAEFDEEQWFTEGVTDYVANLVQVRTGSLSETAFWKRAGEHQTKFEAAARGASLREAGRDKGRFYDVVYSGGFITALALDTRLREGTGGERGVPDLLREMYRVHGRPGQPFTIEDIIGAANRLADADLRPFFDAHVIGEQRVRIDTAGDSALREIFRLPRGCGEPTAPSS